jgi:hypothetical protein
MQRVPPSSLVLLAAVDMCNLTLTHGACILLGEAFSLLEAAGWRPHDVVA